MLRWRSVLALIFWRGMTSTSRACQTSTAAGSSGSFAASLSACFVAASRPLSPSFGFAAPGTFSSHCAMPDEHRAAIVGPRRACGTTTMRDPAGKPAAVEGIEGRDRGRASRHARIACVGAVMVVIGCARGGPPGRRRPCATSARVDRRRGIEHAQRSALGIEELDAVAGLVVGADRERRAARPCPAT